MTRTSDDPQAIATEIRATRSDMSETVDALTDKLDPGRLANQATDALSDATSDLMDQARETFASSARDIGASLADTVKENPLPALALGLSAAWLVSKMGESEQERFRRDRFEATGDPYYAPRYRSYGTVETRSRYGTRYAPEGYETSGDGGVRTPHLRGGAGDDEGLTDKAGDWIDSAKETASDALDSAKETASDALDAATSAASDVGDRAGDAFDTGHQRARQMRRRSASWMDRQLEESPLLVGSVALAAGALVGLALPETRAEHELLGEHADRVKTQALDAAETASETVSSRASTVIDEAKDAAEDVADKAKTEAKSVADDAEGKAKSVASKTASKAKSTAKTAKAEADPKDSTSATSGSASSTKSRSTTTATSRSRTSTTQAKGTTSKGSASKTAASKTAASKTAASKTAASKTKASSRSKRSGS